MLNKIFKKVIGTRNERILRGYRRVAHKINALEPEFEKLSDEELRAKTDEFKRRIQETGESLDSVLPEAFAVVREASKRTLKMRHFDVQMLGGMALHYGKIAEMRTGEGKTLVATLPAYLNALTGKSVHVVSVNDYLIERDAKWMMPVFDLLGITVGINLTGMEPDDKQKAYAADVTYGTNNEFGFDYLRDNMVYDLDQRVQRPLYYAIIDEVDSILIDEARTPLIISGQAEASSDLYIKINKFMPGLEQQVMEEGQKEDEVPEENRRDYILDEKNRQAFLTDRGHQKIENLLMSEGLMQEDDSLYDINNISMMHYVSAALRANTLFQRDVHYIVKDNEILIVDEHTGRLMPGRRWSDGLHQAVEAKEGVDIQLENQTLATITFQNYFRLYEKLSGMTGTADTEAYEMQKIYGLEVLIVPTNKLMVRKDDSDRVYLNTKGKFDAIIEDIRKLNEKGQPILVGTASIESSEIVDKMLTKAGIKHEVLNAKQHGREAKIIAEAGRPGAVTIATNMAGRGTDIVLGGNVEAEIAELENLTDEQIEKIRAEWKQRHEVVLNAGGLHVLGTERNEARRIDNQLRGRSGRQGDAGSSQFYLCLEDNLLRIFASDRMSNMMRRLGVTESDVIESKMVSRAIENAQRRVEGYNFDIRKNLLEYDDVASDQRKVIYQQRHALLKADEISNTIKELREEAVDDMISMYVPSQSLEEQWDIAGLERQIQEDFVIKLDIQNWLDSDDNLHEESLRQKINDAIADAYKEKQEKYDEPNLQEAEKMVMLQVLDNHWKEHLAAMDYLRQGIHLRGYAQKNPTQEFKRESFELFKNMLNKIKYEVVSTMARLELADEDQKQLERQAAMPAPNMTYRHEEANLFANEAPGQADGAAIENGPEEQQPFVRDHPKMGRNDPCSCGSGKKYKQCHGRLS